MKRISLIGLLALLMAADAMAADPFVGGRLFVNPSMKAQLGRTIGIGMTFTIAPIKMVQKKVLDTFRKENGEEYQVMLEAAQYVDPSDIKGKSLADVKTELKNIPQLTPEQKAAIDGIELPINNADVIADLVEIMQNPTTAVTFSMEPFVEFHFDVMDLTVVLPLAGFDSDETDFAMGNVGVDARFGHTFGDTLAAGISYGVQVWAPTGTEKANALGLANLMWSPRYFHEYLTAAPYVVLGIEFPMVTVQASCMYNAMIGVRGEPDFGDVHYLQYGGALSVDLFILTLVAELTGLHNISNAPAYSSLVFTGGLRFTSSVLDLGLAAQIPILQESGSNFASFSNVSFGSPSDFNMVLTGSFGF
jgi:hypothetical protein